MRSSFFSVITGQRAIKGISFLFECSTRFIAQVIPDEFGSLGISGLKEAFKDDIGLGAVPDGFGGTAAQKRRDQERRKSQKTYANLNRVVTSDVFQKSTSRAPKGAQTTKSKA